MGGRRQFCYLFFKKWPWNIILWGSVAKLDILDVRGKRRQTGCLSAPTSVCVVTSEVCYLTFLFLGFKTLQKLKSLLGSGLILDESFMCHG